MRNSPAPKVSVTVVTYNHGEWLRGCLQSIITQETNFPFEIVVGDDCSTDEATQEVLREFAWNYPDLIVPVFRRENVGSSNNWFDVTRRTRGEYIAHIDGDDRMLPGKLQKQADFLDAHPFCSMVGHDLRIFDGLTGRTISAHFNTLKIPRVADIDFLVSNGAYFGHCSKMYRRSAMVSWQRAVPTVDFFLHIEHATRGSIGYIDEVLGEYRKHSGSASDLRGPMAMDLIAGHNDAFDRALELGVAPPVVAKGRLPFNFNVAYDALRFKEIYRFRKYIVIPAADYDQASWRHRLLHNLRDYPWIASVLVRFNDRRLRLRSRFSKCLRHHQR